MYCVKVVSTDSPNRSSLINKEMSDLRQVQVQKQSRPSNVKGSVISLRPDPSLRRPCTASSHSDALAVTRWLQRRPGLDSLSHRDEKERGFLRARNQGLPFACSFCGPLTSLTSGQAAKTDPVQFKNKEIFFKRY